MDHRKSVTGSPALERLGRLIIRFRNAFLIAAVAVIAGALVGIRDFSLYDDPSSWPPPDDPYARVNREIQERFGGTNLVSITVTVKDGDIFDTETLEKVKRITDALYLVPGVIPYAVRSLSVTYVKYMKFHPPGREGEEDFLDITPLMEQVPRTPEAITRVREGVLNGNNPLAPFLVSPDRASTRILADFRTVPFHGLEHTEPIAIYKALQRIIEPESDARTVVRATGTPVIIGWVNSEGLSYVAFAFCFFLVVVAVALWLSFRNAAGVVLPIAVGLFGSLLGFLAYRTIFGPVLGSASVLIAPFIIVASGSCHAVQFLKRFFDYELPRTGDPREAAVSTFASRFLAMFVSLLTDVVAFVVLALIPFENVRALGTVTALGLLSVTLGEFFLVVPAASFLRRSAAEKESRDRESRRISDEWMARLVAPFVYRRRVQVGAIVTVTILVGMSATVLDDLDVGQDNTFAIHNYLTKSWQGNPIYEMEMDIRRRFGGVYPLTILVEAHGEAASQYQPLQAPEVLERIDDFASFLAEDESVRGVVSLPLFIKYMHRFMSGERDDAFAIPDDPRAIGTYFYFYESGRPGAFDWFVDPAFQSAVLMAMVEDTRAETVNRILDKATVYARTRFDDDRIRARIAGGSIGIAGAFNANIGRWLVIGTIASAGASFTVAALALRSAVMPLLLLLPLFVATIVWLAVMHLLGIEINSNTTTSLAMATGVGVDAEVYLLYRLRELLAAGRPLREALIESFTSIRRALVASNAALILGCWSLTPIPLYIGYVGFGMGLILLLTFVFGFVLSPILWLWIRPAFLFRGIPDARAGHGASLAAASSREW